MEQRVYRFDPAPGRTAERLFVFLHASGSSARAMIPAAFLFQARFPSAALVVPQGFHGLRGEGRGRQWFPALGSSDRERAAGLAETLPRLEDMVRRAQAQHRVGAERTALIGYSQGGTVALEAAKAIPGIAGAVVAFSARFDRLPTAAIAARIHLVHGATDALVSPVHAERAARVLAAMHSPVTLDILADLGHALSRQAVGFGSLRLLQGIYERRRATLH